jgi:ribosomal protein S18 acetylase RimI-like enzyme
MMGGSVDALMIEEWTCRTWPALETVTLDGWLLRFAHGVTGRANAVYPLYPSVRDVPEKIELVAQNYRQRALPPMFKLAEPLLQHQRLDAMLALRGYERYNESLVMTCEVLPEMMHKPQHEVMVGEYSSEWVEQYVQLCGVDAAHTAVYQDILSIPTGGPSLFARVYQDGTAIGMGVLRASQGRGGVYCMVTHPDHRGQGVASSVLTALMTAAHQRGVSRLFLHLAAENAAAQTVYQRCGFALAYRYGYRRAAVTA